MAIVVWLEGKNGKLLPLINEYLFHVNKYNEDATTVWRCSSKGCKVYAFFEDCGTLNITKDHNHSPDYKKILKMQCFAIIKQEIKKIHLLQALRFLKTLI